MEAIYSRRAVREFTEEPVDDKTLRQLIDAAVQAPSAINEQPWLFSVVLDKQLLSPISREAREYVVKSTSVGLLSQSRRFEQILNNPKFDVFYRAPALIVISALAKSPWAVEDCALTAENSMLAARALGLGTRWIGFSQGWLGTTEGKEALNLPSAYLPVVPNIVGHPKSAPPAVARKEPQIAWIRS